MKGRISECAEMIFKPHKPKDNHSNLKLPKDLPHWVTLSIFQSKIGGAKMLAWEKYSNIEKEIV